MHLTFCLDQPLDIWVVLRLAKWNIRWAPLPTHTRGTLGTAQLKFVALVTIKHDLPVICDFLDVRTVVVEPHVTYQQNLPIF